MSRPTGESLTDTDLAEAAFLRFSKRASWAAICKQIKCSELILRAARASERWEEAARPYEVQKADLRRSAYSELAKAVRKGLQWAIQEALQRTEGAIKLQKSSNLGFG